MNFWISNCNLRDGSTFRLKSVGGEIYYEQYPPAFIDDD
jgi:hypothetical protein